MPLEGGAPDAMIEIVGDPDGADPRGDAAQGDPDAAPGPDVTAGDDGGDQDDHPVERPEAGNPDGAPHDARDEDRTAAPDATPDAAADAPPDHDAGHDSGPDAPPPPPPPPQPPTFVQWSYATPPAAQASVAVAYPQPQVRGHLNVVVVGWNDSMATVSSVSDSAGNAYVLAVGPTISPFVFTQSIYYAASTVAAPNGNTVTVQFNGLATAADVRVLEYAGVDSANPVDGAVGAAGTGTTTSSGPLVTTAPDLLFAANMVAFSTTGPGPGFTNRGITSPDSDIDEDMFAAMPGTYTATAPQDTAGKWVMQLVAFRAK